MAALGNGLQLVDGVGQFLHTALLLKHFDKQPLREITKKAYQGVLLDLKKSNYAINTIAGVHGAAKMLFKKAR